MSEKKKKALERELMDDLIEEGQTESKNKPRSEDDDIAIDSQVNAPRSPDEFLFTQKEDIPDFGGGFKRPAEKPAAASSAHGPTASGTADDPTVKLSETQQKAEEDRSPSSAPSVAPNLVEDEVKSSVGRFGAFRSGAPASSSLASSENLRIAQNRILELEQEVERLRIENEELAAAGETFRRKADELTSRTQDLENRYENAVSTHTQEKALLLENKESLRHEIEGLKAKNEELELRISTNIQKIRVRERELENRLELVKMEGAALIRSKDELILDLKRQMDQLTLELNNYRAKSQELNRLILDKQDILRRTVKALRLALTMLEGEEESAQPVKRAK